jgi:hypothetical protein
LPEVRDFAKTAGALVAGPGLGAGFPVLVTIEMSSSAEKFIRAVVNDDKHREDVAKSNATPNDKSRR